MGQRGEGGLQVSVAQVGSAALDGPPGLGFGRVLSIRRGPSPAASAGVCDVLVRDVRVPCTGSVSLRTSCSLR